MKRMPWFLIAAAFFLLTACAPQTVPPYLTPSPTETGGPSAAPDTSPAPSAAVYPEEGWWSRPYSLSRKFNMGYKVWTPESNPGMPIEEFYTNGPFEWVRPSTYTGEPLTLTAMIQSTEDCPVALMLLIDGIPARFAPNDETEAVYMYPAFIPGTQTDTEVRLTFTPELRKTEGRADVLFFPAPMNEELNLSQISVYVKNASDTAYDHSNPYPVSPVIPELLDTPDITVAGEGATVVNWLTDWSLQPGGPDTITSYSFKQHASLRCDLKQHGSDWTFYAINQVPGQFRTVFLLDYEPFPAYNGKSYVDWFTDGGQVLQLPLSFDGVEKPAKFIAVTVRLDDQEMQYASSLYGLAACRLLIP